MGTPFITYVIWGSILIADNNISNHVGFAIMMLTIAIHSIILTALNWWVRKWRMTVSIIVGASIGLVFLFGYLIAVIFIPDYFSYTGTTTIFMCLTFILVSVCHFEIDILRNKVSMRNFTREMDRSDAETSKVIETIKKRSRIHSIIIISVTTTCYMATLLTYSILIEYSDWAYWNDKRHLGWTNSAIIGFTDIILVVWGTLSLRGIFLSPFKSSVTLLVTRVIISF
jgi:hypothetical protein